MHSDILLLLSVRWKSILVIYSNLKFVSDCIISAIEFSHAQEQHYFHFWWYICCYLSAEISFTQLLVRGRGGGGVHRSPSDSRMSEEPKPPGLLLWRFGRIDILNCEHPQPKNSV